MLLVEHDFSEWTHMYKVHQDATRLHTHLQTGNYTHSGKSIPQLSASASRDADGRVHLSLCNTHPNSAIALACDLRGKSFTTVTGKILTADRITAHNTFDDPETIAPAPFDDAALDNQTLSLTMPSKSVVVLELT